MVGRVLVFLDETYPSEGKAELVAVAAVAVFESQWPRYADELRSVASVRTPRKLEAIRDYVATREFRAVLAGTRLDLVGATPGSREEFSDVGSLSRRDAVWVQTMCSAAAIITRRVLENGWSVSCFDLYYDPKSLSVEHRGLVHSSLPRVARSQSININGVREVPKAKGRESTELEWGTWLAHWVAKIPHKYAGHTLPPNIEMYDVASYFRRRSEVPIAHPSL